MIAIYAMILAVVITGFMIHSSTTSSGARFWFVLAMIELFGVSVYMAVLLSRTVA